MAALPGGDVSVMLWMGFRGLKHQQRFHQCCSLLRHFRLAQPAQKKKKKKNLFMFFQIFLLGFRELEGCVHFSMQNHLVMA